MHDRVFVISGSAGHLGRTLAERLKAGGAVVVGLDAHPSESEMSQTAAMADLGNAEETTRVIGLWESLWRKNVLTTLNVTRAVLPSVLVRNAGRSSAWLPAWTPEAIADVMLFLCSDSARAIHGAAIPRSRAHGLNADA